jgi:hypothetical protein
MSSASRGSGTRRRMKPPSRDRSAARPRRCARPVRVTFAPGPRVRPPQGRRMKRADIVGVRAAGTIGVRPRAAGPRRSRSDGLARSAATRLRGTGAHLLRGPRVAVPGLVARPASSPVEVRLVRELAAEARPGLRRDVAVAASRSAAGSPRRRNGWHGTQPAAPNFTTSPGARSACGRWHDAHIELGGDQVRPWDVPRLRR